MINFKFWVFKQNLDDYFFEFSNIIMKIFFYIKSLTGKFQYMKKNKQLKNLFIGRRGFLVANGPSINNQNLKLLKNEITFFVNRAFLHRDYEFIKPTFHIFVDHKLATGEWDINFLDQVLAKNSEVTFFLNSNWYYLDKFQPYIKDKIFKIYWVDMKLFTTPFHKNRKIDLTKITYGAGATGVAKIGMIYMGIKDIYFLGKDGNGLCYELIEKDSHFYGTNIENKKKSVKDIYGDLFMMSVALKNWTYFNQYAKQIGVNIFNCTDGGIFNMFERKNYEEVINEK